jgi:hypothetical protein
MDRVALARNPGDQPQVLSLIWTGSKVKLSLWDLLPNGSLAELPMDSKSGGAEVAVGAYNDKRVISIHRSNPNAVLKFEAWKSEGTFELSDDLVWTNDRDPEIVMFGVNPPRLGPPITPDLEGDPLMPVGGVKAQIGPKVGRALVASKTAGNQLRLSLWIFDNGGEIKVQVAKHAEIVSGPATAVSVAKVREIWSGDPRRITGVEVVTAVRGDGEALRLQRWRVTLGSQGSPATFEVLSEVTAPETVSHVTCVPVPSFGGTQVATAVALESGTLKVIGWKMESDGAMTRLSEAEGGGVTSLQAAYVRGRSFVTVMREADGRFKASYWLFPNNPAGALEHRGDAVEGKIGFNLSCAHVPGSGTNLGNTVVAAQTERGDLQLWRYKVGE